MLGNVNKLFVFKSLLTTPSNVLPLHLKQTFPTIIWIFTEEDGDGFESRLPVKIFSTLLTKLQKDLDMTQLTVQAVFTKFTKISECLFLLVPSSKIKLTKGFSVKLLAYNFLKDLWWKIFLPQLTKSIFVWLWYMY